MNKSKKCFREQNVWNKTKRKSSFSLLVHHYKQMARQQLLATPSSFLKKGKVVWRVPLGLWHLHPSHIRDIENVTKTNKNVSNRAIIKNVCTSSFPHRNIGSFFSSSGKLDSKMANIAKLSSPVVTSE
jgi:hypothetical protein